MLKTIGNNALITFYVVENPNFIIIFKYLPYKRYVRSSEHPFELIFDYDIEQTFSVDSYDSHKKNCKFHVNTYHDKKVYFKIFSSLLSC